MVGHVIAGAYAVQGGSGSMLPQENLNFRPSKDVFDDTLRFLFQAFPASVYIRNSVIVRGRTLKSPTHNIIISARFTGR